MGCNDAFSLINRKMVDCCEYFLKDGPVKWWISSHFSIGSSFSGRIAEIPTKCSQPIVRATPSPCGTSTPKKGRKLDCDFKEIQP